MENLESLAKVCRCPPWVKHVPVKGKGTTVRAGVYPDKLCSEVAKLYVASWKRTLDLEFWRWKLVQKSEEVSALKTGWLKNEERRISERQRTHGHEKSGPCGRSLLGASKADSHRDHGPGEGVRPQVINSNAKATEEGSGE